MTAGSAGMTSRNLTARACSKPPRQYGIVYGVTIAMTVDDTKSIGSFGATDKDFSDEEIEGFETAIKRMHLLTAGDTLSPEKERWLRQLAISSTHS